MTSPLKDSFDAASRGYSTDRVVADPDLNERFIAECRRRGLSEPIADLNRKLLNLRKVGKLAGKKRAKRTHFSNEDEYRFAAEMTIRFLGRRDGTSLDVVICDPDRVQEFDDLCAQIAPGYTALQYRWAALNLRKAKKLKPELVARVAPPIDVFTLRVNEINVDRLPTSQGLYLFFASDELLYIGETENLRTRLKKHLDHSDNKGLARWMWEFGTETLHVEIQILEESTTTLVRKALELELIRSRDPIFNVQR